MPSEQSETIVRTLRSQPRLGDFSLQEQRVMFDQVTAQFPLPDGTRCEPAHVGAMAAEWISSPRVSDDRVILYAHGGGYAIGSIATDRVLASRLAQAARARLLLFEYRLAPEHRFPAAVEDAVAAYRWLLSKGVEPERVVIAGVSGGGGLTAATLLALRDSGDPLPTAAVCMSPWVDLTCASAQASANAYADPVVTSGWLETLAVAYLGDVDPRTPLASPVHADLRGLPPLLVQVGSTEILLDEARAFSERARAAGVRVTLDEWPDMFHFWQAYAHVLPEGQRALDRIGEFVRTHVARLES